MMLHDKLAVLLGLTTLALTGCPEEDDGDDTGAMSMTNGVSDTADTEDPGETEDPSGDPETGSTTEPDPTTGTPTTSGEPETTGDECSPDDECMSPADCPNPDVDMCVACFCVDGKEPPTSSDYGPCDMCAAGETPVQITGLEGCFCSPGCDGAGSMCPAPNDGTATATCALGPSMTEVTQCALVCPVGMDGVCPEGATCQDTGMMGVGLCTHPVPG